ncbi:hypothetical protein BJV77DRAFT_1058473 [Russula vinacea]|nr:hypothetical protein BJV77DRAFT_1058473 [Russula vinacea]
MRSHSVLLYTARRGDATSGRHYGSSVHEPQDRGGPTEGSISLARRAPDDVLALIFEHAAAGGWINAPLVASQVCAKWRRASFVPCVWSHVHLTSESLDPVAKTRLWLSRALQSPLFFSIGVVTEQGMDELTGFADAFADAPFLSHVCMVSNRFPVSVPQTVVYLSLQLSDIASSRPSLPTALQMLGTLPALRGLTLVIPRHFVQTIYTSEDPTMETCLHHLERLIIDAPPEFNVLQYLQAPVLQYLHLRSTEPPLNHPHDGTGEALLQFLRSSKPPMKLLELHDVDIRRDDFLRLHETEISSDALLPCMDPWRLDLRWCEQLAGQALVDLVQSRVDSNGNRRGSFDPIEEITVINCALVDESSVLNLAHATVCNVVVRNLEDHCRTLRLH